jgi:solute carrier family 25 S-adenosylmethionine transporter 26
MVLPRSKRKGHGVSSGTLLIICGLALLYETILSWSPPRLPQLKVPSIVAESQNNLVSAAVARGTSIAAFYPIDTYKTLVQITPGSSTCTDIVAGHDGLGFWYAGLLPALIGQIPYGVLTFGGYEIYKKLLEQQRQVPAWSIILIAAVLGDLTGSIWLCPFEVLKQQTQSGMWPGSTTLEIVQSILLDNHNNDNLHHGINIAGLYQGYAGNLARDVPFRVLQLSTYEALKSTYLAAQNTKVTRETTTYDDALLDNETNENESSHATDLTSLQAAFFGGVAGMTSAGLTTPLDVVKTILMTQSNPETNVSWWEGMHGIYEHAGVAGLFAGIVPRVEAISLASALFFLVNERVLVTLTEREEAAAAASSKDVI